MKNTALLTLCLFCCLLAACVRNQTVWPGFAGSPLHGETSYSGEMRQSDLKGNPEEQPAKVFVSNSRLRYEINGSGPFEKLVLLADVSSGKSRLLNTANRKYLEGSFAPQRWVYLEYMLESFPKVMHARQLSHAEEKLGSETVAGRKAERIRSVSRESLMGKERTVTRIFLLSEDFSVPLRQEDGTMRREFTNIHAGPLADTLFTLPAGWTKAPDFAQLLR